MEEFKEHYNDTSISKWDIFHYVYAVLHHPGYREKYAANLRRELPRIPFVGSGFPITPVLSEVEGTFGNDNAEGGEIITEVVIPNEREESLDSPLDTAQSERKQKTSCFWRFAEAGKKLAEIHVNYESQPEYPLRWIENKDLQLNWRVEKMKLSKDKTQIVYNDFLTLGGIPPETFEYRLGNRSALDWIIDQYQVKTDKRSGITNDPNRQDDPEYIVRLIGKVITVSLETIKVVKSLPGLRLSAALEAGS